MGALARIVTGRRSKWLVVLVWLVLILPFGALGGKLADATDNRTESFLPADAESTEALLLQEQRFPGGETRQRADRLPAPGRPHRRRPRRDRGRRRARRRGDPAPGTGRDPLRGDLAAGARVAGRRPRVHDRRRARRQRPARGVGYRPPRCGARGLAGRARGLRHRRARLQRRLRGGLRRPRRQGPPGHRLARRRAAAPDLPLAGDRADPARGGGVRLHDRARARLPVRRVGGDGLRQRRDDPRGADVRGGDRLLPAAGLALPRGAAKARGQARGDGARDPAHRPGDPGQRPDRRADHARAARRHHRQHPLARPRLGDRGDRRLHGRADPAAGAADHHRPPRLLAAPPHGRLHARGRRRGARGHLAPARPARPPAPGRRPGRDARRCSGSAASGCSPTRRTTASRTSSRTRRRAPTASRSCSRRSRPARSCRPRCWSSGSTAR